MFNGISVITHVIVSIWHQPTSPMISSVQMSSSIHVTITPNQIVLWDLSSNESSALEFALTWNSFPHSFHWLELTCFVAGFQGFWVGFLALVLRQAWHCRHHDPCQGSLVKSQSVCLKNLKLYGRAFLMFTKDMKHPRLFKPKLTPRYSLDWGSQIEPITGFQPRKYF